MEGDELYGLALERFVPERTALAKSLRADGRREEAADVAKLRKPSVAAWAVNQLVRTQGRAVAELFAAGDALLQAHEAVVSGAGDARALREATARERAAADALVSTARGLLTSDGHELSSAIIDRVADTLHAAALDEDARAQVREGRLERELRRVGLGSAGFAGAVAAPVRREKPGSSAPASRGPSRPEVAAARRAAREAEAEGRARAERAERAHAQAARVRDRAAAKLREVEQALVEAKEELGQSERALADAEAEMREATQAHRHARDELGRLDQQ